MKVAVIDLERGEKALRLLKCQNPDFSMDKWKVLRVGKVINERVFITIPIDK